MNIILLKIHLLAALNSVERAVGINSNLPILKDIYVSTKQGRIVFTATNLEFAITHSISGKVVDDGEAAIPAFLFGNTIRNLVGERVTLESRDRAVVITTDNYEGVIQGHDVREFPIIPRVQSQTQSLSMRIADCKAFFGNTAVAVQFSEIRPEISGIYIYFINGALIFVGTDSFRLVENHIPSSYFQSSFQEAHAIIPLKTVQELLKVLYSEHEDDRVEIFLDTNQILFKTSHQEIISRLIDGTFPDYQTILPKAIQSEVIIEREELVNAIKLIAAFSGKTNDIVLTFDEHKKFVDVTASDAATGHGSYRIPIKTNHIPPTLIFNWRYLLDGVRLYNSKEITLGINAADRPVLIKNPSESHVLYVVMPIRG